MTKWFVLGLSTMLAVHSPEAGNNPAPLSL